MSFEKTKESTGYFHENNLYLPTNTMAIFGEITDESAKQAIFNLHILDNYSPNNDTVTVFLSSEGGDVSHGLAIFDAIRAMKKYVRIVCWGEVASMATVILQAGDERCMTPNSYMMVHFGEESTTGDPISKKNWDTFLEHQKIKMMDIYLEKIKIKKPRFTKDKLTEMLRHDTILKPDEALTLGLIDKVINEAF